VAASRGMSHATAEPMSEPELDRELHGWFGDPWPSSDCYDDEGTVRESSRIDVPVGQPCLGCGEAFDADSRGTAVPVITPTGARVHYEHRECTLRERVGSLAHLEGRCACRGGAEGGAGDEGRSRREEALLVWEWVQRNGMPQASAEAAG
jgi:hypothetical protein